MNYQTLTDNLFRNLSSAQHAVLFNWDAVAKLKDTPTERRRISLLSQLLLGEDLKATIIELNSFDLKERYETVDTWVSVIQDVHILRGVIRAIIKGNVL